MTTTSPWASLEEMLNAAAELAAVETDYNWARGDFAMLAMEYFGGKGTLAALAALWRCSTRQVMFLHELATTFPPHTRAADANWGWHKSVMDAAVRFDIPIEDVMDACLGKDMRRAAIMAASDLALRTGRDFLEVIATDGDLPASKLKLMNVQMCPTCGQIWRISRDDHGDIIRPERRGKGTAAKTVLRVQHRVASSPHDPLDNLPGVQTQTAP